MKVEDVFLSENQAQDTIESEDRNYLQDRISSMQRDVVNSIQITLNRDIDRIQRLSIEYQNKIGQDLNNEFYKLSDKASEIVGQRMKLLNSVCFIFIFKPFDYPIDCKTKTI